MLRVVQDDTVFDSGKGTASSETLAQSGWYPPASKAYQPPGVQLPGNFIFASLNFAPTCPRWKIKELLRIVLRHRDSATMPPSASERTPLLRSTSANHPVTEDAITTAEVAQQGQGAAPQFPTLQKARSGSLTESVDPGDVPPITDETESLTKFQKNGKLEGVGEWKFRFVFGGILLGYFVS